MGPRSVAVSETGSQSSLEMPRVEDHKMAFGQIIHAVENPGVRRRGVQAVSAVGGTGVITGYPALFRSRTIFAKCLRWLLALTAGPVLHSELLGAKSSKWDDTGGRTNGRQGSSSGRAAIATRPCIG